VKPNGIESSDIRNSTNNFVPISRDFGFTTTTRFGFGGRAEEGQEGAVEGQEGGRVPFLLT
jgi:hypothetical protein